MVVMATPLPTSPVCTRLYVPSAFDSLIFLADIVFTGEGAVLPDSAINEHYIINFDTLKFMGDQLMTGLVGSLNIPVISNSTIARAQLRRQV